MFECSQSIFATVRLFASGYVTIDKTGEKGLRSMAMERCDECGFTYDSGEATNAAASIVAGVDDFAAMLAGGVDVRTRREPKVWSPLEYGCHVRDVLLVQRERVLAARRRDRTVCEPMGRDERVEHDGYAQQDPTDVARQLVMAAQLFAHVLDRLGSDDWDRILLYNYPHQIERSLRWVAVHTLHEVRHHARDANRQLPGDSCTGDA